MTRDTESYLESLREAGVEATATTAAAFERALSSAVEAPAVGVELPFEGVSLSGTAVDTDPTPSKLRAARTGVTAADLGIVEYGSLVVGSTAAGEEPTSLYPERHVAVVAASDVVADMTGAVQQLAAMAERGQDAVVATGPSATADMGELVEGVHGPSEVHAVVLEDR